MGTGSEQIVATEKMNIIEKLYNMVMIPPNTPNLTIMILFYAEIPN